MLPEERASPKARPQVGEHNADRLERQAPVPGRATGLGFLAAPGGSSQDSPTNLIIDKLSGAIKVWWRRAK